MSYSLLKTLHVVGTILFVGNIMVTAIWKLMADRTRVPPVVAFGQRLVTLTDFLFTAAGAALVIATGLLMLRSFAGNPWDVAWIRWGLILFVVSGVLWGAVLVPVQIQQARLARRFVSGSEIPERYWRLGRVWMAVGIVATLLPLANVVLMVFKPL